MNVHSGAKPRLRGKVRHSRRVFGFLPAIPHDYIERRRMFRNISNVLLIVFLSLLIAGIIVYSSNPTSFSSPHP